MGFGCSPWRGDHESGGQVRGGYCTCPALLSVLLAGQAWSRASFCRIEFHFQPLLGRSHGSLQIFDNEAKYTSESEEAWAAVPNAWERGSRLCGHPRPGPRRGSDPQTSAQLPAGGRPTPRTLPLGHSHPKPGHCPQRPARGPLAEGGGASGISRVGRCWREVKVHLATGRDVRSPPEPVLPGYLGRLRRAPTCRQAHN